MDSQDSKPKFVNDGFKGFEHSEVSCKPSDVTKKPQNGTPANKYEAEIQKGDGVDSPLATSNSSCDNNFPNISQVTDSNECRDCDTQVLVNLPQEKGVDLSEHKQITESQRDTALELTQELNDTSLIATDPLLKISTASWSPPNSLSPEVKKLNSKVLSCKTRIQDVVDRVNKLDIVEKPNTNSVSSVIFKNESSSLRNLLMYGSSDEDNVNEEIENNWQHHVFPSSSSSSDSDSDSQDCVEISDDDDNIQFVFPTNKTQPTKVAKSDREDVDIAPPLDLSNIQIDYEKEQFLHIGHITNFIDATVTIDALENTDSYNIETVLFIDDNTSKQPLGGITDVIGPVSRPVYCVQLRDSKDIEKLGLKEGMNVYSAPKSQYTKYVFLKDLLKMKGTDASWIGDEEQPSDDDDTTEEESDWDEHNSRKRSHNNSLERHRKFEKSKNRSNLLKSQVADMMNRYGVKPRAHNIHMFPHGFDPRVPPPPLEPQQPIAAISPQPQPNFRRTFDTQWSSSPMPNAQRWFQHPHSPQGRPRHNHTNYFANNMGYHHNRHNSAGPSHQNYY